MLFPVPSSTADAGEMRMPEAQRALAEEKADANLLFSLSFYFEQAGRPFSAIRAAERAIEVDPKVPGYHARLGQLFSGRKRLKDAAAAYGRAADMDPATKSFRAAEARALSGCWMLKEAARSWKLLLDGAATPEEVKDAARNLAGAHYQLNDPAGAEAAWTTGLDKLEAWDDRLIAADETSRAMLAGKAAGRAVDFWEKLLAKETEWPHRAAVAERMAGVAAQVAAAGADAPKLAERAEKAWRKLLEDAKTGPDKQRAALAMAEIDLRAGSPERAAEVLRPVLYAHDWNGNYGVAGLLARALAAAGDGAGREALWREFLTKSGDYSQRSQVAEQLAGCLEDQGELVKFRREMAAAFPKEISAQQNLAEALAAAGKPEEAVDVYEALLPLVKRQPGYGVSNEYDYWQRMVELCAEADRPDRALELMQNRFAAVDQPWQVSNWLSILRGRSGEYAALGAADRLAESGGVRRLGAAHFLLGSTGQREAARALFDVAAADKNLKRGLRHDALQNLMHMARGGAERLEYARRRVALGWDNRWESTRLLSDLANCLALQGEIAEGAQVVRNADKIREDRWTPGPDVLGHLADGVFQGRRVGPGLRTPEGQKAAEDAAEGLYKDFSARTDTNYPYGLQQLLGNLAELHARRGDYDGAVDLLHRMCAIRDSGALRLVAAGLLDRQGADQKALAEHLAYADAAGAAQAEALRKIQREEHRGLPGVDGRFMSYLETKGKDEEYVKHAGEQMEKLQGRDREGAADLLLAFLRERNRPEDMGELLKKLRGWGHKSPFYAQQEQWVTAAIKMKNAASQADAQRREGLLKQAKDWEARLAANPEDYGAAVNAYKTWLLLGRKESDGQKFMDRVKETAEKQRDPLVLELWGRELMLEKMYANASKAFALAAEITGRRTDYEESMISAFELSGKHREAVNLALDSAEEGRSNGRGFRTVEQIMDMAERSDNLKHLHAEVKKRAEAAVAAKQPLREDLAGLALRLAWDNADDKLAGAAIDALALQARDPARPWQDEWRLTQLAERAVERRRLADAIRVRRIILDSHAAAGYEPDVSEHQALAMQLLEAGQSAEAAELMFAGLSRVGLGSGAAPRPRPRTRPWRGRGGERASASSAGSSPLVRREASLPWTTAIMSMAAREAESGGKGFREAVGERLAAMVESEMKLLEKNPAKYSGPIPGVEVALGLRERVTAAYRAAAKAEGASAEDHLALATRLVGLTTLMPKERRPADVKLEEISAACAAAAERAEKVHKAVTHMAVARLYRQLLAVEEKDRLSGVKPELALGAYEAAAAQSERWGLDAFREALELARQHRVADKALEYARKLHEAFPKDTEIRRSLSSAQLAAGQIKEALAVLNGALDKNSTYQEFQRAAELCMTAKTPPDPEAAAGAADFLKSAIGAYLEEVGAQLDAKGRPLPDAELGQLQGRLSAASAAEGRPEAALEALVKSLINAGETVIGPESATLLADAYAKAGKLAKLVSEMEEKVKADPQSLNLRLAQATVLEKAGKPGDAAAALTAAKALKPELSIVKRLVDMLRKAGSAREALAECRGWAASFPRDAEAYKAMAEVYHELKDEEGEIGALTMLVEVAPREAANCRQVAVLFAGRKDWPRAVALMERAVELRPEEPYRHVDLAEVLFMSAGTAEKEDVAKLLERAAGICADALKRDWEKGLSPELLARMPPWKGTFEVRAQSLLGDIYDAQKKPKQAAQARLNVPAGYKRPELEKAVPVPGLGNPWPRPMPVAGRGGRWIEE
ncbi:MAG TPA: tetratricopeptide repeat protein [Planctomycetota bacterium]|nr:tetratricopeptide repeat protein [Planctomycetota bacterium]